MIFRLTPAAADCRRAAPVSKHLPNLRSLPCVISLLLVLVVSSSSLIGQESQPGLVATYSDGNNKITRIVAVPHLSLGAAESIHPQIGRRFTAEWKGLLRIDRAGQYHVFANGGAVQVDGEWSTGLTALTTGEHPLRISFNRSRATARMELRWQSEFFGSEPVPSSVLRHLETPAALAPQDTIEQGRFLFAELGCENCHAASDWQLQSRRGPDLSHLSTRIHAGWLDEWLKNPHSYRKAAVMPSCLETEQDRADVAAFLMSLNKVAIPADPPASPQQVATGRILFDQVGCANCHDKENNLDAVGSKYVSASKLAEFIADPHAIDPAGRMPQLFPPEQRHLAGSVAKFLFAEKKRQEPFADIRPGDVDRGAKLFATTGCASCHVTRSEALDQAEFLRGPAFSQSAGLPLRHFWDFRVEDRAVRDRVTGRTENVSGRLALAESADDRSGSFDFDGQTFIELPHFHRPDKMTISVWVKTTQGGSIITWGRPGGGLRGSRELRMNIGQDGKNSICYGEYNSDGGWKPVIVRPSEVNLVDGTWHHLAVVRKGEDIQHFVDGKLQGGGKTHRGSGDYTDRLLIGALALQTNPSNRFRGLMDDLSVWEMALSADQVAELAAGISPETLAAPPETEIKPLDVAAGCLAENVARPLPDYQLGPEDREALQQFLLTVQPAVENTYQHAPLVQHDLRVRQFRCTKCHELNDQNIQKGVAVDERGRIVRIERPPSLTGVGAKLTPSWLRGVLLEQKRNRPWLNLRMPHFGDGVSDLPELISAAAGVGDMSQDKPDRSLAMAGHQMIGVQRGKVACIACHDFRGINRRSDGVVPAPDLADVASTVRHDWFNRWMHDPQRIQPGTSMPQLFLDVTPEERELRISQLWSALYYQQDLPLPDGVLQQQTEGTRIIVRDKPVLFRMATITPVGRIDRAINVGIPGGLNFTFDPVTCQLKYAWKGDFIDAGPAWNGRGGNPVRAAGQDLVRLEAGHTIRIGENGPENTPRFLGYRLEGHMPVFRYQINGANIEHRINCLESRVTQKFTVRGARSDVVYAGNSEAMFRSQSGQRDGDTIKFPQADVVEFEIEMLLGDASGN